MLKHLFTPKPKPLLKAKKGAYPNHPVINLCDMNLGMCEAWMKVFSKDDGVNIFHGNILQLLSKAIVSPANSFGDMSGGLDKAIDDFYKGKAQVEVGKRIETYFLGEIPVGSAMVVDMGKMSTPYLVVAPTMRIPGTLNETSINAYLAMRAVLVTLIQSKEKYPIDSVSIPGLATGIGGIGFEEAASQMRVAFEQIYNVDWKRIAHPAMAPYANRRS